MRPRTRFWLVSIAAIFVVSFLIGFQPVRRPPQKQWPDQAFVFDLGQKPKEDATEQERQDAIIQALVDGGFQEENLSVELLAGNQVRVSTLPLSKSQAEAHKKKALQGLKAKYENVRFVRQVDLETGEEQQQEPIWRLGNIIAIYPPQPDVKLGLDLQGGMHVVLRCLPHASMTFLTAGPEAEPLYATEAQADEEQQQQNDEAEQQSDEAEQGEEQEKQAEAAREEAQQAEEADQQEQDAEADAEPSGDSEAAAEADEKSQDKESAEQAADAPKITKKELEQQIRARLVRADLAVPDEITVQAVAPDRVILRTQAPDRQVGEAQRETILHMLQDMYPRYGIEVKDFTVIPIRADTAEKVKSIIDRRLYAMSEIREPMIQKQGNDQIIVELPGVKDPGRVTEILKSTAMLEFVLIPERYECPGAEQGIYDTWQDKRTGEQVSWERVLAEAGEAEFRGDDLKPNSQVRAAQVPGEWVVTFELKADQQQAFHRFTRANVGRLMAIVLDNECQMAPVIKSAIPGQGIIEGHFGAQEAGDLKLLLNAGALPVPLEIVENRTVSATLGEDTIHHSLRAALVGLAVVLLFMIAYYRLPGVLAGIALFLYILIVLAVIAASKSVSGIGTITLTLPGIAGIILSIGMAVDANIIIFERLKEELWAGKSMRRAIAAGFDRAWTAILDANVTTLIITIVLYFLGTSLIKSFATTLIVGILCSLFTAVTVTRWLVSMVGETSLGSNMALYGISPADRDE